VAPVVLVAVAVEATAQQAAEVEAARKADMASFSQRVRSSSQARLPASSRPKVEPAATVDHPPQALEAAVVEDPAVVAVSES
jgi:hypothetical protein